MKFKILSIVPLGVLFLALLDAGFDGTQLAAVVKTIVISISSAFLVYLYMDASEDDDSDATNNADSDASDGE